MQTLSARSVRAIALTLSCTAPVLAQVNENHAVSEHNPVAEVEQLITTESVTGPLRFLSHDLLEGRGVASRGDELSRLYLATQFEMLGLKPGGKDGSYEQPVPILGITSKVTAPLQVTSGEEVLKFSAPTDYTAEAGRPESRSSWEEAEIVFVGYGIHAPEQKWDDYGTTDLKGKVLLVMNNDPESDPDLFAGKTRLYYGRWSYKYEEAARRGAVGAIVIHTTPSAGYPFQVIQNTHGQENFWLPFDPEQPTLAIRSWCSEDAARKICQLAGQDLNALRARALQRDFQPVPLGVRANLTAQNTVRELQSGNVLGVLPGSDEQLKHEHVIVTAHHDHLGIGPTKRGDSIYNGGLDNATGCAALVNLARACAALPQRPKRSIIFASVTAEESGLLGSLYYARNPTVDRKQLIANYNIDGINIWGRTKDLQMIGHGKNSLTALADRVAKRRGRVLLPNKQVDLGLFYRSDHFSFARIGVPAAYFKAGAQFLENTEGRNRLKRSYTAIHYHQPSDEFDRRWRLQGAVDDLRLLLECMVRTANDPTPPTWTAGDEFEKLR